MQEHERTVAMVFMSEVVGIRETERAGQIPLKVLQGNSQFSEHRLLPRRLVLGQSAACAAVFRDLSPDLNEPHKATQNTVVSELPPSLAGFGQELSGDLHG